MPKPMLKHRFAKAQFSHSPRILAEFMAQLLRVDELTNALSISRTFAYR